MSTQIKKVGGKIYIDVEIEEEISTEDLLEHVRIDEILDHFDHNDLLERIPKHTIKQFFMDNISITAEEMFEMYGDNAGLRQEFAKYLLKD
ncbi:MAG: hypothetical protein RIR01_2319 [Bacteroidota bacterium]